MKTVYVDVVVVLFEDCPTVLYYVVELLKNVQAVLVHFKNVC